MAAGSFYVYSDGLLLPLMTGEANPLERLPAPSPCPSGPTPSGLGDTEPGYLGGDEGNIDLVSSDSETHARRRNRPRLTAEVWDEEDGVCVWMSARAQTRGWRRIKLLEGQVSAEQRSVGSRRPRPCHAAHQPLARALESQAMSLVDFAEACFEPWNSPLQAYRAAVLVQRVGHVGIAHAVYLDEQYQDRWGVFDESPPSSLLSSTPSISPPTTGSLESLPTPGSEAPRPKSGMWPSALPESLGGPPKWSGGPPRWLRSSDEDRGYDADDER